MADRLSFSLESERLRLVATSEGHARDIFTEFTDEVTRWMYPRAPRVIEDTLEFLQAATARMKAGREVSAAILLKTTGEFLGVAGLHNLDTDTPELGIWIKAGAHGHRYGREAVTALADWAWANGSYRYLIYPVDRRNIASRRIAESLGGIVEAEYQDTNESGNLLDNLEYHIYPP